MAKNLKLNIKNTQLAEALKINKVKKAVPLKKKEEEIPLPPASPVEKIEMQTQHIEQEMQAPLPPAPEKEHKAEPVKEKEETPPPRHVPAPTQGHTEGHAQGHAQGGHAPGRYAQGPAQPRFPSAPLPPRRDSFPQLVRAAPPPRKPYEPPAREAPRMAPPRRPFSPRPPMTPRQPPAAAKPQPAASEQDKLKKPAPFKEYRDLKPTRKPELSRTFDSRDKQGLRDSDDEQWRRKRPSKSRFNTAVEEVIRPKHLKVRLPITIKDLAVDMKLKASQLIAKMLMQGTVVTLNDSLADEITIQLLGQEFDCEITIDTTEEKRVQITDKTIKQEIQESDAENLILRPPVVTFMGHVDHGKTSLIDAIRKSNVAGGEAGEITQHIGAFTCHTPVGNLTILDTPGHEAFSAMRTRGADVTDIIVLVVAGDEGIRAQTVEAIQQAKTAKVPIVVALNKCDKPNFNAENVYRQLADQDLLPESWGGMTITVNCSALTGVGIKELLEMLALQTEVLELKANPHTRARGTVIESEMHKGLGAVATVLVQNGSLRLGDSLVFTHHWARVKTMHDEHGKEVSLAGPSAPVKITGLSGLPEAGSEFIAVKSEREARELSHMRTEGHKRTQLQQSKRATVESLMEQKAGGVSKKILPLILRADVQGSLEALKNSLKQIASNKVEINVISSGVGEVSESDIELAAASKAVIIGFHTQIESHAETLIKELHVIVKSHDIIYHAIDDVKDLMRALLDKIAQENETGAAQVKTTFKSSQLGIIAGCIVTDGNIKRGNIVRVMRDNKMVWKGPISSLKRMKEDVREVSKGFECGILLQNFSDLKEGDILQAYEVTYLEQDL